MLHYAACNGVCITIFIYCIFATMANSIRCHLKQEMLVTAGCKQSCQCKLRQGKGGLSGRM